MSEGIRVESYISVPGGTEITLDLQPADGKVEIQLGTTFGLTDTSLVRLAFDEPETLTNLVKVAMSARAALMAELGRQLSSGATSEVVPLPAGSGYSEPVFGTYEQLGNP